MRKSHRWPTDSEWEYSCRANSNSVQYGKIEDIARLFGIESQKKPSDLCE